MAGQTAHKSEKNGLSCWDHAQVIRPAFKIGLEILGMALAAVAVAIAAFAWRLSQGPLPLSALTGVLETELNRGLTSFSIEISDMALVWDARDHSVAIYLKNVNALDKNNNIMASLPKVAIDLSPRALIAGYVAPTKIDILEASATILRRQDGRLQLGLAVDSHKEQGPDRSAELVRKVLDALADPAPTLPMAQHLNQFRIRDSAVTFYDQGSRSSWYAPRADFEFLRDESGLRIQLRAELQIGNESSTLILQGHYNVQTHMAQLAGSLDKVNPALLAAKSPALVELKRFAIPVRAHARLAVTEDGRLGEVAFNLQGRRGKVLMPGIDPQPFVIHDLALAARYDPVKAELRLDQLSYRGEGQRADITGALNLHFDDQLALIGASGHALGKNILLTAPVLYERPLVMDRLEFKGAFERESRRGHIESLTLEAGKARLHASGSVVQAEPSPAVDLNITLANVAVDDLKGFWPQGFAEGARHWIAENVIEGELPKASFIINAPAGELDIEPIPPHAIQGLMEVRNWTAKYIETLPPLRAVNGLAVLTGNSFELKVDNAYIAAADARKLTLSEGRFFTDDFHIPGNNGRVETVLSGNTSDILAILDLPPFEFASKFGIDPAKLGGASTLRLDVSLPLRDGLDIDDVKFAVAANMSRLNVDGVAENFTLHSGEVAVKANGAGLIAEGTAIVNDLPVSLRWSEDFSDNVKLPSVFMFSAKLDETTRDGLGLDTGEFVQGPLLATLTLRGHGPDVQGGDIDVDLTPAKVIFQSLNYHKAAGKVAKISARFSTGKAGMTFENIRATSDDLDITAHLAFDREWHLLSARSENANIGESSGLFADAVKQQNGVLQLALRGTRIDGRGIGEMILGGKTDTERDESPTMLSVDATFDKVILHHGVEADALHVTLRQEGDILQALDLSGTLPGNLPVSAKVSAAEADKRHLKIQTQNAGALLKGLDYFESMADGHLQANATFDDSQSTRPLQGTLTVDHFRIVDAPVLAKILSLASFTGMNNLMKDNGISFTRLTMPFTAAGGTLEIKDARLHGPALGLTVEGWLNEGEDRISLSGSIVPAYAVNSFIGAVPVVGDILVGRKGEGIFGITYAISGAASDPKVSVNPLSAFAPGFLRRLFEMDRDDPVSPSQSPIREFN
jgi:hypothetical protein